MLDIILDDDFLCENVVFESLKLHSDLLDIYEDVTTETHYSLMCESANDIQSGLERIKSGFKDFFNRLKAFFRTIIDKFISLFVKKSRATNIKKERLRDTLQYVSNVAPFTVYTHNYNFNNNLDRLFDIAYTESHSITSRLNNILNKGEVESFYTDIKELNTFMVSDDSLNKIRRSVLNTITLENNTHPLIKSQFIPELQLALRGGTITKTQTEITKEKLLNIIDDDDKQIQIRKNLEFYKNNMDNMFNILTSEFNNAINVISHEELSISAVVTNPYHYDDVSVFDKYSFKHSEKLLKTLNGIFSASVSYFKNLSDIVSIAFTEYTNAISEAMTTNAEIFTTALTRLERG